MTLYLIGLGLADKKDITIKGLETIRSCSKIYLENYTSVFQDSAAELEHFFGKKITPCPRKVAEEGASSIVEEAKGNNVAFLVIGDPFSATTHIELYKEAHLRHVPVRVIHNASILTAVGITGLQLYKFGKTTSIPFVQEQPDVETPYHVIEENQKMGLHTLLLLDLRPQENTFMTINKAIETLFSIEQRKGNKVIANETLVLGCARLGSDNFRVRCGRAAEVQLLDFGAPPHCLIVPGKLHFSEEEMLELWRI